MRINLYKSEEASESVLTVMIWAIFSLIMVRIYLMLTGYPQIGHGSWHISHALTGGFIMIVGTMISLTMQGRAVKKTAAGVFGFGLGWFIDEIGKYLTKDYNYFFQPAVLIIYIFFVVLFFVYRYFERSQMRSNEALFQSVINQLREIEGDSLPKSVKKTMIKKLERILVSKDEKYRSMAEKMLVVVRKMKVKKDIRAEGAMVWTKGIFKVTYDKILKRRLVIWGLWGYSIYYSLGKIWDILMIGTSKQKMTMVQKFYEDYNFFGKSDIFMIVFEMVFELTASILFLVGARYFWSNKRLRGIRFFKYGLYVSIFLVSVCRFYFEQLGGLVEVVFSIAVLGVLDRYQKELIK